MLPKAKRLRKLWFEWPESCYERFNVQPSEPLEELVAAALSERPPSVVVLAGACGIGRRYLCRAAQHHARAADCRLGLWNLDLHGFEPDTENPLATYLHQLITRQEREQANTRKKVVGTAKSTAKALTQTELVGQASEWAAALLSLLWQFEDPMGRFAELLSQPGRQQVAPRDDPETLRRLLDVLTQDHKLLVHVQDVDELPSSLRRWLIRQAERSPERLLLVMSCGLDRKTEDVAPYCLQPCARIELHPLRPAQLRSIVDRCFHPNALSDELIEVLIRQSGGRPGVIANWIADLMELSVLDCDSEGLWRLSAEGLQDQRVVKVFAGGLFEDVDRRIAEESPQQQKVLHQLLVLAALGGAYVPLSALFDHLQLVDEAREVVTDFWDDVLDEDLGWFSDCGFQHPSFPGANVYSFSSSLLPQIILDQISDIECEMRAISFLRFLEQRVQPAKRGMARWFLEIASHLGDKERQPYEHQLAWWWMLEDAEALRQEIRDGLHEGKLKPEVVWGLAEKSAHWPPFRRLALLEAYGEVMLGAEASAGPLLSMEHLASFRILRSELRYSLGQFADSLDDALLAQPLVEGEPLRQAIVFNLAGVSRLSLGEARSAQVDFELAIEIYSGNLGPGHPSTLTSQGNLAATYRAQGNYDRARELHEEVWEALRRVLGPEHPETLTSQGNLAATHSAQGNYDRAREIEEDVWEARRRLLGPQHPETLTIQANLAETHRAQGNYDRARELHEEVWETFRRILGPEHPETLTSQGNLASTYGSQGNYDRARELEEEVWETFRCILGPEHPETLTSQANLAETYSNQGDHNRAREIEEDVWESRRRLLGPEHPATLTIQANLAATHSAQGNYDRAKELEEKVYGARLRVLGPEHPSTLTIQANLATTHLAQGNYDRAREIQEEVWAVRRRLLGPEHPDTFTIQANLASTHLAQGNYDRAREIQEEVWEALRRLLGPEHPDTLTIQANLAETNGDQGNYDRARQLQEEVWEARRRVLGPEHPDTLASQANLELSLQKIAVQRSGASK